MKKTKKDIQRYWPIGVVLVCAVAVTAIAGWQTQSNLGLGKQDSWGFYLWFAPLGYTLLTWYFAGTDKLNRPMIAFGAILVYGLSAFLLFVPNMPPGLQWHYPIGAACLLLYFLG